MPSTSLQWWALYPSVATFLYLKPEYAMLSSYAATVVIAFAVIAMARIVTYLTVYPEFLTPMKEIPTPGVSSPAQRYLRLTLVRTEAGSLGIPGHISWSSPSSAWKNGSRP